MKLSATRQFISTNVKNNFVKIKDYEQKELILYISNVCVIYNHIIFKKNI